MVDGAHASGEALIGVTLADRYRLDRVLGRGASGVVFQGVHTWTDRAVAVKVLDLGHSPDSKTLVERFFREAKAAAALPHPHVVDVLDMGNADGVAFLVLELLSGESLADRLLREPRFDPETALTLLLPIMDALQAAHDRGLIHRDVKPENIFLHVDAKGRAMPKILDFGIVKPEDAGQLTTEGHLLGTPHYMSPEQAMATELGPTADIWSMGVLLFRVLSGTFPFDGRNPTMVLANVLMNAAPSLALKAPDVPRGISAAVDHALQKKPGDRPPSMRAFMEALVSGASEVGLDVAFAGS